MLTVDRVNISYDNPPTLAVQDVSLQVGCEIVALLGPSGCGKSSLLRAIAGLEVLAGGMVSWDGKDLAQVAVHARRFGLVFQDGQLFNHKTVAQNVSFGLQMAGVSRTEQSRRVTDMLRLVDLEGFEGRATWTISGGQAQRVAVARALAPKPQLLLLDEPLSALDMGLRRHLAGELRRILVAASTPTIIVTHDHDEAFTIADRVAVMLAGRIVRIGTPADVWRKPGYRAVAEFLGYEVFLTSEAVVTNLTGGDDTIAHSNLDRGTGAAADPAAVQAVNSVTAKQGEEYAGKHTGGLPSASADGERYLPTAGEVLAVAPGGFVPDQDGSWEGQVCSVFFRDGEPRARVEIAQVGVVTIALNVDLDPSSGPGRAWGGPQADRQQFTHVGAQGRVQKSQVAAAAAQAARVGDTIRLRLLPARTAWVTG